VTPDRRPAPRDRTLDARADPAGPAGSHPAITRLSVSYDAIADFCRRWQVIKFELFGSVLRDDFRPDSDVDALVTFDPDSHPTLFDLVEMQEELEALFGRDVDLLTRRAVESSRNPERRQSILSNVETVFGS
jgi:uncharacterized protein